MRTPKNATERLTLRPAYIPKAARPILEHENGSALYVYETAGKFYLCAFWGTSAKPSDHCCYRTEDQRQNAILAWRNSVEQSVKLRTEMREKRKAEGCTLKAGDIVNTSWGYDQTNVDFFVVTRVSGKRVYLRGIKSDYEATGFMAGRAWPSMPIETHGDEFWAMGRGNSCLIDGHHASLTTGDCYTSSYA
jgi:hypothetical protein